MGHIFKILPTPPYRKNNILKAKKENIFLFDSLYFVPNGDYTNVYGFANEKISLPFKMRICRDLDGKHSMKDISFCYDIYGRKLDYIPANQMCILCIENLDVVASRYGFTGFDDKQIN